MNKYAPPPRITSEIMNKYPPPPRITSEIWTAQEEREGMIVFEVQDEATGQIREEKRHKAGLPLMLLAGGYVAQDGFFLADKKLPWHFRKVGNEIYLD